MIHRSILALVCLFVLALINGEAWMRDAAAAEPVATYRVWPDQPPAWTAPVGDERDTSGPDGRGVAGRSVIRLGDVRSPELHLYPVSGATTTVIVCPGGGFSILAWDLEGTEVAEWLQANGVSAAVLKYRVPTGSEQQKWLPAVQDLQRSLAIVRGGAIPALKTATVGVLGFSAGGHTVARAALAEKRMYEVVDDHDQQSYLPDFAALVYPAYLSESKDSFELSPELHVTEKTPPMFFAHAFDDSHSCMGSVALFAELKRNKVPSSLHVFSAGGHGFGARDTKNEKDAWMPLLKSWLVDRSF